MELTIKGEKRVYLFSKDARKDIYELLEDAPHYYDYNDKDEKYKIVRGCLYLSFLTIYPYRRVADLFDVDVSDVFRDSDMIMELTDEKDRMICKELLAFIHNNIELHPL